MTNDNNEAAAAAIVEGRRAAANLAELHGRLEPCFARSEPFEQAGKYMGALLADVPRKNGWQIAEYVGDATPDRTQRLLNHAVWDHDAAQGAIRGFVAEQLRSRWWWRRRMSRGRRSPVTRPLGRSGSTWAARAGSPTG